MKVKDILPDYPVKIMVRMFLPENTGSEDCLFGYCRWDGKELISEDGDSYFLEEEIVKYEFDNYGLTYWIKTGWM